VRRQSAAILITKKADFAPPSLPPSVGYLYSPTL